MRFLFPENNSSESQSLEGLEIQIHKSPNRKIGYYAAVYNKYGYQVSVNTEYAFRKRDLKHYTVDDFDIII